MKINRPLEKNKLGGTPSPLIKIYWLIIGRGEIPYAHTFPFSFRVINALSVGPLSPPPPRHPITAGEKEEERKNHQKDRCVRTLRPSKMYEVAMPNAESFSLLFFYQISFPPPV